MLKYSITMGIRLLCIVTCFFVPGYWIIIPAIGAIFLPYVAVVLANMTNSRAAPVLRPDQLALPAASGPPPAEQPFIRADHDESTPEGQAP